MEAAMEAKDQGLTRFIGVTGHGLLTAAMHVRSLERYEFDSVLLPWNYVLFKSERYRQEFEKLLEICKDRGVAVQTIKSITKGPWAEKDRTRNTWYEPLEEQADIDSAVHWLFSRPGIFLNTAGDIHVLPKVLDAASRFKAAPSDEEMKALVARLHMTPLFV